MGLEHDFPVKEHELPRLHVPAQRLEEWKEVAQDEITRALSHRHSWYNAFKDKVRDGFDMIADKPNLKAFVRPVPDTPDKDILIRSTLEAVTLDDLVAGMYCDSTYDVRCTYAHMYESNFLDAGILQVHERKTDEDPMHFVGMRWIAFRSPAPAIVTSRDFLFFSYEGTAYDVDGNRVLFRFLRSMPMDGIEVDSSHLPPLVRGKISNLHLYRQNGSRVDAFTKAMHSNAGAMPSWIVTKTISFMFPGISNVETVCDARALLAIGMAKLNPGRITHHSSMSSNGSGRSMSNGQSAAVHAAALSLSANACGVCFHKFKMTRAKRRCQGCCREVCKRCTRKMWFFDEMKQIADTGVVALRFCLNCTRQARAEIREATAAERHHHRSSLGTRRSSSAGSASSSTRRTLVRRIPSQPEMEPTEFYHSNRSHHKYADEDSDDDSDSYNPYSNKQQVAPSHIHPLPHQLQQLQQLHHLQQQCGLNQEDHDTFVRLYGQYANRLNMAPQYQQSRGSVESVRPVSSQSHGASGQQLPRSMHRHNSDGVAWSHVAAARSPVSNHRGRRSSSPMHMIPPMPQPDAPSSSRSHMTPLSNSSRQNSAPNLYAYDHNVRAADRLPRTVTASSMSSISSTSSSHATHMSEDLEAIFRLRTMLFDEPQGGDHDTVSTSSTSSAARRPPPHQNDHQRADLIALPPPIVQRY